jgi:hypothetical protein
MVKMASIIPNWQLNTLLFLALQYVPTYVYTFATQGGVITVDYVTQNHTKVATELDCADQGLPCCAEQQLPHQLQAWLRH